MIKKKIKNIISGAAGIVLPVVLFIGVSCKDSNIKEIPDLSPRDTFPDMRVEEFKVTFSDRADLRFKLTSKELLHFEQNIEEPYQLYPQGLNVESFDEEGNKVSEMTCNFARHNIDKGLWFVSNNVVAVNKEGDTIKTEEMYWDDPNNLIYSDKFVRVIKPDEVLSGIGFTSNESFTDYEIKNIHEGVLYLDEE